jgi:hypothetical protein
MYHYPQGTADSHACTLNHWYVSVCIMVPPYSFPGGRTRTNRTGQLAPRSTLSATLP